MPHHRSARSLPVSASLYVWAVAGALVFIILIVVGVVPHIRW